jgi:hypothetical protein
MQRARDLDSRMLVAGQISGSQSFRQHLRESDERPRSHLPPFFRSVIHAGIQPALTARLTGSADLTDSIKTMIANR